jgi:hypothetical protein
MRAAALLPLAAIFALLALNGAMALVPNLDCPVSPAYPKNYFRDNLGGQNGYMGTTTFQAYVQIDVTGEFDLVKVGNFTGTYVRYYSNSQRRPIDEYYINVDGTPFKAIEITTTPIGDSGKFCLNFNPPTEVTEYVEGISLNDKFFIDVYYNKTAKGGRFGEITRQEFFNFARNGVDSLNILTVFDNNDASIESMTFFKFHKISNSVVQRCEETEEVTTINGVAPRSVRAGGDTFTLGKGIHIPIEVIDPEYRHLFASSA